MGGRSGGAVAAAVRAAPCAVAVVAAAVLWPVPADAGGAHRAAPAAARPPAGPASAACADPEASLRPRTTDGPAVRRIKDRGRLIAGVDQNSYRWGYRDPATRELSGFDIDLVRAVAKAVLGDPDKVTFLAIPTNQRIPALEKGKVDIIARTMTINCDRIKQVAFSTAYFEAGQQVLAPKGSPVTAFDDSLKGKKVCTAKGSTGESELRHESHGASVLTVPNQLDCLVRLQLGQVDAVITDSALAAGQAAQDPSVRLVGKPFTTESYGVAMNLGDEDLVRRVNAVLEDYRRGGDDSPWMLAYRKWLAADLKGITAPPQPKYKD
ncbi:sugar-binding protein [Streptomyces cinnamoneus]|uniref:Sugar-binding protein n=1 Tax=Streptomyces cinnamoneus TaxID=53446 RepID=A0A2G1XFJ5_STRCJ|nr:glutamate ABC transporter substrate-binding protein [Streptomyces cinnamoneus]PHQ50003.1 sugar-binding protein [Streptomyces cinnamoneus]PPT13219.1 sugar-binding protein [Streptomyces cinnamoneus]